MILSSCLSNNKPPKSIIQPKEMQNILWDVMRAQALATEITKKDSLLNDTLELKLLTKKVFEIHKTNTVNFNKSYSWYIKHPEAMTLIFDSLYAQKELSSHASEVSNKGQSDSIRKRNLLYDISYKKYWVMDSVLPR
jgi:hypothetical protein